MRYLLVCTLLLACLCAPFAGQSNEWHRYRNTDGNFSVLMPVEPQDTVNPGEQTSHTIQAIDGGIAYAVIYVTMPTEQPVNEPTFKVYRDSFLKGLPNCELKTEAAAAPAIQDYIGHWYRLNCTVEQSKLTFVGNLYWGRHYAYGVLAMFQTGPSDPATARKFTDSFSVIDTSK